MVIFSITSISMLWYTDHWQDLRRLKWNTNIFLKKTKAVFMLMSTEKNILHLSFQFIKSLKPFISRPDQGHIQQYLVLPPHK